MMCAPSIRWSATNDGALNDGQGDTRHFQVFDAIQHAPIGIVDEGARLARAPEQWAFGWKGGIGTSSRKVGGHTVGVLVQSNFGGRLTILGVPTNTLSARQPMGPS